MKNKFASANVQNSERGFPPAKCPHETVYCIKAFLSVCVCVCVCEVKCVLSFMCCHVECEGS